MKNKSLNLLVLLFLTGAACAAQNVMLPPPPDTDPFVGTWLKNNDKSQPITKEGYLLVESSHSETISREGEDVVVSLRRGRSWGSPGGGSTGLMAKIDYRFRCDGNSYRLPFGTTVCKHAAPNVMEGKTIYDRAYLLEKHETFYWRRDVSTDGKQTKDSTYKDVGMKKPKIVTVFDRVK